jgi:predicted methyltransferase
VTEVAGAVGLAEGEAGVRAVIAALSRLEPVSIRHISRAAGLPVPIVASICGELRKRSVVAHDRPAQLTATGRELFAGGELGLVRAATCRRCSGGGIVIPKELSATLHEIAALARAAPQPRLDLDQCHCTAETKLRRVLALHEADALVGRRILLLGDDDLTSLTIDRVVRRFGSDATIAGLAVVDVDPAIVEFVRRELADAPFPVLCVRHDLRAPLPEELRSAFDTVFTDPPYTISAARLFLSRAAEALEAGGDVFLSFGSRRPDASFRLQLAVASMGFAIEGLSRDFNEYVGAGVIGGTSHLYRLTATSRLRSDVAGVFDAPLYTAEAR